MKSYSFKKKLKIEVLKILIWNLGFWKIIWRWHLKKLNLEIKIFENLFENDSLKKNWKFGKFIWKWDLKKLKLEFWNFGKFIWKWDFKN